MILLNKCLLSIICLVCIAACAPSRNVVVLVPDRDGHVGTVTITNQKGSTVLTHMNESVIIADAKSLPGKPVVMDQRQIAKTFEVALSVEPSAAATYIFYFNSNSSELNPGPSAKIDDVVKEINRRNSRDISVNGHTDTQGNVKLNLQLSRERTKRISELLVKAGVDPAYLSLENHGKGNPAVPTGDNVNEPRNRRVEVIVR